MIREISVMDLKTKLHKNKNVLLLDVRTPQEIETGKIAEALSIPMNEIPSRLNELDENQEYIVICRSGIRSLQVAHFMMQNGYSNVSNVRGGMLAWAQEIDAQITVY